MPTTRPRYQITDTGEVREMLDLAQTAWPESGRKELLLRLAELGSSQLATQLRERSQGERRDRQRSALERAPDLLDVDVLRGDDAWR